MLRTCSFQKTHSKEINDIDVALVEYTKGRIFIGKLDVDEGQLEYCRAPIGIIKDNSFHLKFSELALRLNKNDKQSVNPEYLIKVFHWQVYNSKIIPIENYEDEINEATKLYLEK